jgi:hypothetical protein
VRLGREGKGRQSGVGGWGGAEEGGGETERGEWGARQSVQGVQLAGLDFILFGSKKNRRVLLVFRVWMRVGSREWSLRAPPSHPRRPRCGVALRERKGLSYLLLLELGDVRFRFEVFWSVCTVWVGYKQVFDSFNWGRWGVGFGSTVCVQCLVVSFIVTYSTMGNTPRPPVCHCLGMTNVHLSPAFRMFQSNHICPTWYRFSKYFNLVIL